TSCARKYRGLVGGFQELVYKQKINTNVNSNTQLKLKASLASAIIPYVLIHKSGIRCGQKPIK
ncbi:MAG: hypothetical protein ACOC6I_02905, partial [Candidatus Bipolaricaulota bacterium]